MFVVRAIQSKDLQMEICKNIGIEYKENALAYFAADLCDNGVDIDSYISICQFYFCGDAEIIDFKAADGRDEDEAVIVMLRAVMSFMHRCGVKTVHFAEGATNDLWLKKSGFICVNGVYSMDLEKFYTSPCRYSEEHS